MSGHRLLLTAIPCLLRLACAILMVFAASAPAADVPYLSGRVVDDAQLLSPAARDRIDAALKAHEDKTTNQLVVLTVPTLDGDSIEPYATRVFEAWKPGRKGKDNGALLIVVPKERKIRIEVGYGLEGVLTDAATSRIIRNVLAPRFKANQFDEGMEEGVAAMTGLLQGDAGAAGTDAAPAKSTVRPNNLLGIEEPRLPLQQRLLFGAFIFGVIGLFTVIGIVTPGVGWFLYVFLIPFWALFPIVAVGADGALALLGVYLVAYPALKLWLPRSAWYRRRTRTTLADRRRLARSRYGGVTHSGGGWWSSSDTGGSSDSGAGSFSGGGGDSGGGGSSGDF